MLHQIASYPYVCTWLSLILCSKIGRLRQMLFCNSQADANQPCFLHDSITVVRLHLRLAASITRSDALSVSRCRSTCSPVFCGVNSDELHVSGSSLPFVMARDVELPAHGWLVWCSTGRFFNRSSRRSVSKQTLFC